jgi:hypothetical protein
MTKKCKNIILVGKIGLVVGKSLEFCMWGFADFSPTDYPLCLLNWLATVHKLLLPT